MTEILGAAETAQRYRITPDAGEPVYLKWRHPAPKQIAASVVYVMGNPHSRKGPVKIGVTTDLVGRLAAIRSRRSAVTPAYVDVEGVDVLAQHPGDRHLERRIHRHYAAVRLVGEWFDLNPTDAENILVAFLADTCTVEAIERRGTNCTCYRCSYQHPPDLTPGRRPEWDTYGYELVVAVHSITHARLGVDLAEDHVSVRASHCDIDRAVSLLGALAYRKSVS